ncbi:GTPase-activating protein GYP5 [Gracilariopsis chorda]|uniref:GTPase-activating protein GYP5 n=1 Tax=Gracilariopsis chorda TaxID=448386 RepID=A0A2V3INJ7_9FLOR|nr:GTPase-activating protein GYP5 [Gracilariopsis chorda]|eukprot:PXF43658.1 GTPase-activating protein GYP5 [Gracilariopsis chorda]
MATAAALAPSAPLRTSTALAEPPSSTVAAEWPAAVSAALRDVRVSSSNPPLAALQRIRRAAPQRLAPLLPLQLHRPLLRQLAKDRSPPPRDRSAAVLLALHALCSLPDFRSQLVDNAALPLLLSFLAAPPGPDRPTSDPASAKPPALVADSAANAALRVVAKLLVCHPPACANAIPAGALPLLAASGAPSQPLDLRLRACAALAAIAAWSGPRNAVQIVETPGVVAAMCAVLEDTHPSIPPDLRLATIDALVAMSHRGHARRVLQRFGCDEKITIAARHATLSGDYTAAARSTVAAGHLTGRSIDEYGFFVQDAAQRLSSATTDDLPTNGTQQHPPTASGLSNIAHKMMHEPYTSVDDLTGLEHIVDHHYSLHQSAPVSKSSPHKATAMSSRRSSAMSTEHLSTASPSVAVAAATAVATASPPKSSPELRVLSVASSPQSVAANGNEFEQASATADHANIATATTCALSESAVSVPTGAIPNEIFSPTLALEMHHDSATTSHSSDEVSSAALAEHNSSSSPRRSANFADPDFDKLRLSTQQNASASQQYPADPQQTDQSSGSSDAISPLLMFSSATKEAAERDGANGRLQKTNSQITRESKQERVWRQVMDENPHMLKRERGRSSRVVAYRELALVPVPPAMRRRLWPILLDTKSLRDARPGLYVKLCKAGEHDLLPDDIEHTIQADVTRTMPSHALFWSGGAQVGVQSLRSILRAYARYVPSVGYCQGMSSIAAVFLMNAVDEEEAFLMFAQFMSRFQYKKVFAPGFPLMLQWISELRPLVAHYMPQLHARLERENVSLELYADKWLITALSHNFPHRHLLRIWDLMFLGGSPKIILKACLAVLKECESRLMEMDFETMMPFLQRGFAEADAGVLDAKDPEPFVAMMREFRFMPDIPKSELEASQAAVAAATAQAVAARPATTNTPVATGSTQSSPQKSKQAPQQRKSALCCLPCFSGSATID